MSKSVSGQINIKDLGVSTPKTQPKQISYMAMIGHGTFIDKKALIPIRLNNPNLVGAKFEALMATARMRFDEITIIMMDTIENHLIDVGGHAKGTAWMNGHKAMLNRREREALVSWADLKDDPAFKAKHSMLELLYQTNEDARYYIHWACANRMRAMKAENPMLDEKEMMKRVLAYRLEELAGLSVMRDKGDVPELCPEDYVSDDLLFDRLSKERLSMPRVFPVTFQSTDAAMPLMLEDD